MKIKVIQRSASQSLPSRSGDPTPRSRNLDPALHPFARAREYTRALTAAKMERIYAKPFVCSLEGHVDGVYVLARDPERLGVMGSGSGDGEIILHHLPSRTQLRKIKAHDSTVSGLTFTRSRHILSCSADRTIKLWEADADTSTGDAEEEDVLMIQRSDTKGKGKERERVGAPVQTFGGKMAFNAVDHHRNENKFVSASNVVQLWDETKTEPILNMQFSSSAETVLTVKFNQSETSVLASTGTDRTMCLYDVRTGKAERRVVMALRANAISWHPTQPTGLLLASEDHNLYTFDIRNLATPTQIYKGHVAAVMACDYSPTGTEFVSGSWDRTVRIWKEGEGRSADVYHGKRMQRVFASAYTQDARFVLSGSDDGNVRLWKARASDKLGVVDGRERAAREYRDALRAKWAHAPEVRKVERQRYLPKPVYSAGKLKRTMEQAQKGKEERRRMHTREGEGKPRAERRGVVLVEQE